MATATRIYRKPQPEIDSQVEDSAAIDPGGLIALCEDLLHLEAEGLIVSFQDERGIVRYRAIRIEEAA